MHHFESFNLITIRKKRRRAYTRFKEVEFNDKIEFLGASWAEDFVCLMEFPREWPGKLPICAQPYTAMVWLRFSDLLACPKETIFGFYGTSYFSHAKIHRRNSYGEPFLRRKMLPCDRAPSSYCTQHCHEVSAQSSTKNWMPIRTKVRMKYIFLVWSFNAETFSHSVKILRYI